MVQRRDFVKGAGAVVANCVSSRFAFGQAAQSPPKTGTVPPPPWGLRSNSNYFLYNGGKPITGLSVVVDVTKDIVAPSGFSIQLNAFPPRNATSFWQQYVIGFYRNPSLFGWTIENWLTDTYSQHLHDTIGLGTGTGNQVFIQTRLTLLPDSSGITVPSGYKFKIVLAYDPKDASGAIIGATFTVTDNHGKSHSTGLQRIQSYRFEGTKASIPIPAQALAPILAFELNIVAAANVSFLESGAGTITYSATSPLTVANNFPPGMVLTGTGEQANTVYGALDAGPSRQFTQTFEAAQTPKFGPGGAFAVSQRFGTNETALFAISIAGQLVMFTVDRFARWQQSPGYGPINMADPYSPIAVLQRFGVNGQTGVFFLNQDGQLLAFWVDANGVTGPAPPLGDKHLAPFFGALAASQQFGADQTDVFLFDGNGQLNVFWSQGAGSLNGPVKIGPAGFAPGGAQLAVSQRFGVNQTDVFVVDKTGALSDYRVVGTENWKAPAKISEANFANPGAHIAAGQRAGSPNQLDVFLVDKNGQLNVFSIEGTGSWTGPVPIGPKGLADSGAPVAMSTRFGAVQTDVFVVDKKGTLNVISVDGAGAWSEAKQLGPPGLAPSGAFVAASQQVGISNQTDVFLINQTGTNAPGWPVVFWVDAPSNSWNGPKALVTEV